MRKLVRCRVVCALTMLLGTLFQSGCAIFEEPVGAPPPPPTGKRVQVWYATNRTMNKPYSDLLERIRNRFIDDRALADLDPYSATRSNSLNYGSCWVEIPKSHKRGSLGSTFYWLTGKDAPLRFLAATPIVEAKFWDDIHSALSSFDPKERRVLVFIHGYNTTFGEAALRTAQIWADLGISGIPAFFSWPSRGGMRNYPADEASIEASEDFLKSFLVGIQERLKPDSVHVIAHSMGNRALLRVVYQAVSSAQEKTGLRFAKVFLAAPDVDIDVFNRLAGAYPKISERTTLYVSTSDGAVFVSEGLHDYSRVGAPPPFVRMPNIETIEVRAPRGLLDLGHGYFSEYGPVLDDIQSLIIRNTPGSARKRGEPPEMSGPDWIIE